MDHPSIRVRKTISTEFEANLPRQAIIHLLEEQLDIKIPDNASVTVAIPGGGDYSNQDLDLDDQDVVIRVLWTKEEKE